MRYLQKFILSDLEKKMVFVGGPRQSGKTYMAQQILEQVGGEYLNWDDGRDRRRIQKYQFNPSAPLIVFDELHKSSKWKQWIKGVYDTKKSSQTYLVTGSARLDIYRRGGDSLFGRYHYWRMHPFTIDECGPTFSARETLDRLMLVGGFPEPFLTLSPIEAARWRRERFDRIIKEDIRDIENIRMIAALSHLADLLKERVGSQISYANLAADLEVAPKTIKSWIDLLARMYLIFIVPPYTGKLSRALQKAPRIFFYDNMDVEVPADKLLGARFENLVAANLLKRLQFEEDQTGAQLNLCYLRDRDDREVDFVLVRNKKVDELIEVTYSDERPSSSLKHYSKLLKPRRTVQIVYSIERSKFEHGIEIMSPLEYFREGPWSAK